jgi:methionyl-tRNA formyltransferase
MKIVFMGTPQAAVPSLEALVAAGHEVSAVYTQPDRPSGRGYQIAESPVKQAAVRNGIAVFQPTKIRIPETLNTFRSHAADVTVVVAYGRILPAEYLNAFSAGAINVHFSLLPKYRGAAPVNWAIVNGETESGVTTMQMDEGLDTGDILLQQSTPIDPRQTSIELMERLSHIGADLLLQTLDRLDGIKPVPQNHSEATLAPIMSKKDGEIDWSMSAAEISCRVRGFQPFPTAFTWSQGKRLTIWRAEDADSSADGSAAGAVIEAAGEVIEAAGEVLRVTCGGGSVLNIYECQPEGKRRMQVRDFLNGANLRPGDVLGS